MNGRQIYLKLGISPQGHHFPCWVFNVAYSLQKDIKVYRKQHIDVITRDDL